MCSPKKIDDNVDTERYYTPPPHPPPPNISQHITTQKKNAKTLGRFSGRRLYTCWKMLSKDLTPNISTHKAWFWVFSRDFTPIDVGVLSTLSYEPFLSTGVETGPRKLQEHVPYKYLGACRYVPGALLARSAANSMSQHVTAIFATSFTIRIMLYCGGGCWNKRIIKNPPHPQKKGQTH